MWYNFDYYLEPNNSNAARKVYAYASYGLTNALHKINYNDYLPSFLSINDSSITLSITTVNASASNETL
jgi:hypothetical protein